MRPLRDERGRYLAWVPDYPGDCTPGVQRAFGRLIERAAEELRVLAGEFAVSRLTVPDGLRVRGNGEAA